MDVNIFSYTVAVILFTVLNSIHIIYNMHLTELHTSVYANKKYYGSFLYIFIVIDACMYCIDACMYCNYVRCT
jgi:hypothetical protein